jgi:15-cis-phytoene synthase
LDETGSLPELWLGALHVKRPGRYIVAMPKLSPVGALVRRADPDRFLTALFAPPERREALFTLYAFNNELARARESTTQPMLAMIRLQWWREVVEGAVRSHEVATPLTGLLETGMVDRAEALALIDAREAELDSIDTLAEWRAYLLAGAGGLAMAAGRVLGTPGRARLRALGAAYGVAGVLRSVPALARAGHCVLPVEVLAAHDLVPEAVTAAPDSPAVRAVVAALAAEGRALLAEAGRGRVPAPWRAAALPGALARRDLKRPGTARPRGLGDRLAVMAAAATGWV